ncbi:F0F1 ATP synthase subunit gamma [Nitrogeniibacter mangrovi]|uniref:F0F1 ATP synthase subunit gamma n=1 Tax=Nitrogeniibacter mangrovi TaxID=2016596 RepID=UPI001E36520F|nr:F0F1 ATP synthase subunit gamma [Nitrogeniibacter mangrovi]
MRRPQPAPGRRRPGHHRRHRGHPLAAHRHPPGRRLARRRPHARSPPRRRRHGRRSARRANRPGRRAHPLLAERADALPALVIHHAGSDGIAHVPLLPIPAGTQTLPPRSHPVDIHLPPPALQAALLDQYLDMALSGLLLEALLHENEQRLAHMDQARRNVDDRLDTLGRRANRARQEEITEEIEIILLAGAVEGEGAAG